MKKLFISSLLCLAAITTQACPVCERQQPKILRGIVHGAGPQDKLDYLIIISAVVIVLISLWLSVRYLVRPGEKSDDHIKRFILKSN